MKIKKSTDSHLLGKNSDAKWKNKAKYKIRRKLGWGGGINYNF